MPRSGGTDPTIRRFTTYRGLALALLSSAGCMVAVLTGQPVAAVFGATMLAWPISGVLLHRWPAPNVDARLARDRVVEGDTVDLLVTVDTDVDIPWLAVEVECPDDLPVLGGIRTQVLSLPARRRTMLRFELDAGTWGLTGPRRLRLTARDRLGLFASRSVVTLDLPLRVHPSDQRLDAMVHSTRTRARVGHHLARQRGEGCEYADLRPAGPGDRLRSVNWRVSLRRGEYWVSDRHPDQASDVVLLVDSSQALGRGTHSTIHAAVRAAIALTEGHLSTHDRVGVLDVGRQVRWFTPRMGRLQRRRLIDALLDVTPEPGLAARSIGDLPLSSLGSGVTIVALTPLLDPRPAELLLELRSAGYDVVVVWCKPDTSSIRQPTSREAALARRLWTFEQEMWQARLVSTGIPLGTWDGDGSLDEVLALLDLRRRIGVGR